MIGIKILCSNARCSVTKVSRSGTRASGSSRRIYFISSLLLTINRASSGTMRCITQFAI
jgi:hypothetical protein